MLLKNIKKAFKDIFEDPTIVKIHVTALHNRGFPDLLIVTDLGVFFIEVKRPGNKPTVLQRTRLNEFKRSGKDSVYTYWMDCHPKDPKLLRIRCPETDHILGEILIG